MSATKAIKQNSWAEKDNEKEKKRNKQKETN